MLVSVQRQWHYIAMSFSRNPLHVCGLLCFQVAKKLVKEAESNIGKKEYDANDGLVRHSDATKIQVGPHFLTFSHPPPSLAHSLTHCSLAHLLAR